MVSKFVLPGILLALTLAFGLWLSLAGKPYNSLLFNVHKLIALAAVVVVGVLVYREFRAAPPATLVVALLVLAGICVIALFATGAIMSIGTGNYQLILTIHRIALVLLPIALIGMGYFLTKGKVV
ncbi:MAG TPA: hypothetical protein VMC09_03155 [Anaerolineales bacterium]|nr:hypothetical protein [Anaerolineales bacterium]